MASLLSSIILVLALGVAATAGIALLVGLFRVSGGRPAGREQGPGAQLADESPTRVS
jgi:hypothetical protein